jgi:hypothetical protein
MKDFMNALWNAKGVEVTGFMKLHPFHGEIVDVRVMYGGNLQARIEDKDTGETFLINGDTLANGGGGVFNDLHVYF